MRNWLAFLYFFNLCTLSLAGDTLTAGASIIGNQTLISKGGNFELGFFTPGATSGNRYLGIWFKKISVQTVVWVANREAPINGSTANLTIGSNGALILQVGEGNNNRILWSSNSSNFNSPVAQLLDTGNLVVRDATNESSTAWQSFDHPCDTLLPGQKLGWNLETNLDRYLSTWNSADDPSVGDYSFKLDLHGSPEFYIWDQSNKIYRNGPWMGYEFSGEPEMQGNNVFSFDFFTSEDEVYYTFETLDSSVISRFVLNQSLIQRYVWVNDTAAWSQYWSMPRDQCDNYAKCGPYGVCDSNNSPVCDCLKGFVPKSQQNWNLRYGSDGCVRRTPLQCGDRDGFFKMTGMKLPDTARATVDESMSLDDCRRKCLRNCSCIAYSSASVGSGGSSGCITWGSELIDLRLFVDSGDDLYIRLAASELDNSKKKEVVIIVVVIVALILLISAVFIGCFVVKKRRNGYRRSVEVQLSFDSINIGQFSDDENKRSKELDLPLFNLRTIVSATDNFSDANKLGEGGFGSVYKGKLVGGEFIAVKRLSEKSSQGIEEFMNEVKLIAKLQHNNLVRLLGCCIQGEERMLIYEYMDNRSLDTIIFDKSKSSLLSWQKRFNIIAGVARGLLYLHQDSRFRIIHRDLKASNILLDKDMNPKISDFGLARAFGGDGKDEHTKRLVGTLGYMAPEYAMDGIFSVKSDVFSFGVLVLEIVSGKKNRGIFHAEPQQNLLSYAWNLWKEGNGMELLDESINGGGPNLEVLRCIQVGLLCVQERAEERPEMSMVVLMLGAQVQLRQPKPPGFCSSRTPIGDESSSSTVNNITVTVMDGR